MEVYAKAGRFLVEFPDLVNSQAAMDRAESVLDAGLLCARQLQSGQSQSHQRLGPADCGIDSAWRRYPLNPFVSISVKSGRWSEASLASFVVTTSHIRRRSRDLTGTNA